MAYIVIAYIVMAYIVIAYIVMAYIVIAYIVMAYTGNAYGVIAYIVLASMGALTGLRCAHAYVHVHGTRAALKHTRLSKVDPGKGLRKPI